MPKHLLHLIACLFAILVWDSCSPLISSYDQYSYAQTTSLKVDAINLMSQATEDYSLHEAEAKQVSTNIQKIIEYETHIPKDTITIAMWRTLSDTSSNLFGGFIKEWKTKRTLKPAFVKDKQEQVSGGFDKIIKLEVSKIHN